MVESKLFHGNAVACETRIEIESEKGVSTIASFAIILMLLTAAYTYYQVEGVSSSCASYELKHFGEVTDDFILLASKIKNAILNNRAGSASIKLGSSYPEIPFFSTPSGFSGMLQSYYAEISIQNAVGIEDDVRTVWDGREIVWTGNSLKYIPSYVFYDAGEINVEYGVVAVGRGNKYVPVEGKIISDNRIFLPLLRVNVSESSSSRVDYILNTYSGGGREIVVTDNGNPIKITLKTSLSKDFWEGCIDSPYISSINYSSGQVEITLSKGVLYKIVSGAVSLDPGRAPRYYLYRLTPYAQTTPASLWVEVRDQYNNPVSGAYVTFRSNSTTLTDGTTSGTILTVRSDFRGVAAVVATDSPGSDVVVASIVRPDGTPYEVAFTIL